MSFFGVLRLAALSQDDRVLGKYPLTSVSFTDGLIYRLLGLCHVIADI